jgi:hypothetical protein
MDWPVLVIALIPVAVWILATIFRGVEEAKEKGRPPRPRGDGAQVKVPRRPAGELDRFLDEARRRREPSPKRRAEPTVTGPLELERVPVEKPAPRPPVVVRREPPKPRKAEAPVPVPVAPPVVVVAPPLPEPPLPPPPQLRPAVPPRPASPLVARLGGMLRDRDSLALAFVLREVFDRPVSQRRVGEPPGLSRRG